MSSNALDPLWGHKDCEDKIHALQKQNERLRELLLDSLWRMPDTKDNKEFKKTVKAALQEEKTDE